MRKYGGNLKRADDAAPRDMRGTFTRDVRAVEDDLSRRGFEKFREQIEAGGLACAVRTDQRMDRTAAHAQIHAIHGGEAFEFLGEATRFQNRVAENHVPFHAK